MITEEQINNLKPGDPLIVSGTLNRIDEGGDIWINFPYRIIWFPRGSVSLYPEIVNSQSSTVNKYDPNRKFKKGDRAQVVERNGRNVTCFPVGRIKVGDIVTVAENETGDVFIKVLTEDGHEMMAPWFMLKLVTPVEELEPYYIQKAAEFDAWRICNRNDDVIFHFNPDPCNQGLDMTEIEKLAREQCDYLNERFRDLIGKAAAEAELDRLNAEYRKETHE